MQQTNSFSSTKQIGTPKTINLGEYAIRGEGSLRIPTKHKKKEWGSKNCKKKEAILYTNDDFGRLSSFPEHIFVGGGVIFKMDLKPLVFRKNPRTHLEVQGSFGDEGSFQECQKP